MADIIVKQILSKPIQLADQVTKLADQACSFRQECLEIKAKTEKLAGLLRQVARASNDLYERPTRRIIYETEQVLDKALILILKCKANGIKRIFTIIPTAAFKKLTGQLENSTGDVTWLLHIIAGEDDSGMPPIAQNEPYLSQIWQAIAQLCTGNSEERANAAGTLVSLAKDNDRYSKVIIEEGGIPPLVKYVKEGRMEGQLDAITAIGMLGRDPESVEHVVNAGVSSVFAKVLKEGHMKVQVKVAEAIAALAATHPDCQDHFAQNNIIRFLVSHLAFETIQEHSKYAIASKHGGASAGLSIHTVVMANTDNKTSQNNVKVEDAADQKPLIAHPLGKSTQEQMHNVVTTVAMKSNQNQNNQEQQNHHVSLAAGSSIKGREYEDPQTKSEMKAMASRALWFLCAGNLAICRSITESRALLCFAVLLEKAKGEIQYNSAMALTEITAVAEQHSELRRSAFKPTSPAARAVIDQFLGIIEKEEPADLLIPSIQAIGHLARTFRATESRIIGPLVKLLDDKEPEITCVAAIALTKFVHTENFLHVNHAKSIIQHDGAKHLIPLIYFGEQMVQIPSLILLCYVAMHVPDSKVFTQEDVIIAFEWTTKQEVLMNDPQVKQLVQEAKNSLHLYQSR